MSRKDKVVIIFLSLVVGFMYVSGLPLSLVVPANSFMGTSDFIIPVGLNILLSIVMVFLVVKLCRVSLDFKIKITDLSAGIKDTILVLVIYLCVCLIGIIYNCYPFTENPTVMRIILESIVYYLLVAIIEELLLRGLIFNLFAEFFKNRKNGVLLAIIVSSVLFAIGHVPSVISEGPLVCIFRFLYPFGFGVYAGYLYKKTDNLVIPIIYHFLFDSILDIPMAFTNMEWFSYKPLFMVVFTLISIAISIYSFVKVRAEIRNI